jgi:hypothetical protein
MMSDMYSYSPNEMQLDFFVDRISVGAPPRMAVQNNGFAKH